MNDLRSVLVGHDYIGVMDGASDTASVPGADDGDETQAAGREDATELIETGAAPAPDLAWSVSDDDDSELEHRNGGRARWLAAGAALLVAVAAVGVSVFFWQQDRAQPEQPVPAPSAAPTKPAPPSIVQPSPAATAAPRPAPPGLTLTDADWYYIDILRSRGVTGDPSDLLAIGHTVCRARAGGLPAQDAVEAIAGSNPQLGTTGAQAEIDAAITAYCPQYAS